MTLGDWRRYWLAAMLVLAMVLGPALGQMHRAVHAAGSAPMAALGSKLGANALHALHAPASASDAISDGASCATSAELASSGASSSSCGDWVHALFAGHGPADCQLLDQANHGFAGPPAVLQLVGEAPDSAQPAVHIPRPRAIFVAASFDARAPPALQLLRA